MPLINCYECGSQISDQAKSCPHCGAPSLPLINCYECEKQITDQKKACPNCGAPSKISDSDNTDNVSDNDKNIKVLAIAGVCIAVIAFIIWYSSPYQQCLRQGPEFLCKLAKAAR